MHIIANNQTNNSISLLRNTSVSGVISFKPSIGVAFFGNVRRPLCLSDVDGHGRPDICENYIIEPLLFIPSSMYLTSQQKNLFYQPKLVKAPR